MVLEERYAYYRRCQTIRRNGEQCRAPAVKGQRICCKHQLQKEMQERWERQRASLGLPERFQDARGVLRAMNVVGQAMLDNRLDEKPAGRIMWELSMVLAAHMRAWRMAVAEERRMRGPQGLRQIPRQGRNIRCPQDSASNPTEIGISPLYNQANETV